MSNMKMSIEEYDNWSTDEFEEDNSGKTIDKMIMWVFIIIAVLIVNIVMFFIMESRLNARLDSIQKQNIMYTNGLLQDKLLDLQVKLLHQDSLLSKRIENVESKMDVFEYNLDNVYKDQYGSHITIRK